jgi:hypothetical protein
MDLATAFGATTTVRLCGRDYTVGPIDLEAMIACAGEMKKRAGDPFESLMPKLAALPEALAEKMFREALSRHNGMAKASPQSALIWALDDPDGLAFLLWHLIDCRQAGVLPREAAILYLLEMRWGRPEEYAALIEQVADCAGIHTLGEAAAAVHRAAAKAMTELRTAGAGPLFGDGSSPRRSPADAGSESLPSAL